MSISSVFSACVLRVRRPRLSPLLEQALDTKSLGATLQADTHKSTYLLFHKKYVTVDTNHCFVSDGLFTSSTQQIIINKKLPLSSNVHTGIMFLRIDDRTSAVQ